MTTPPEKSRIRLTKERILEAGLRHFGRRGFRRASLTEIAQDLGVVKGALYYYIPGGKQKLFDAVLSREQAGVLDAMRQAVEAQPDPRARLRVLFDAKFAALRRLRDMLGMSREVGEELNALIHEREMEFARQERALITEVLHYGATRGVFRQLSAADTAAAAFQAVLRSMMVPSVFDASRTLGESDETVGALIEMILTGLEARN